jgi:hypothetical protein
LFGPIERLAATFRQLQMLRSACLHLRMWHKDVSVSHIQKEGYGDDERVE